MQRYQHRIQQRDYEKDAYRQNDKVMIRRMNSATMTIVSASDYHNDLRADRKKANRY